MNPETATNIEYNFVSVLSLNPETGSFIGYNVFSILSLNEKECNVAMIEDEE